MPIFHAAHPAPALLAFAAPASASTGGCPANSVESYFPSAGGVGPFGITEGPGGTWYADSGTITRINNTRTTNFSEPDATAVGWLAWDGTSSYLWSADRSTGRLGTIDGNGAVHEYQIPDGATGPAIPQALVLGPGPQVWFTDDLNGRIGDLDTATGAMTMYPVPGGDALGMVRGPDGALWFTERNVDKIGRMTPEGTFTEWSLAPGSLPNRITVGPDGAIWFTELFGGRLGRIDNGVLTEYPIDGGPVGITLGPDDQLYVALAFAHQVARVDSTGTVTRTWPAPGSLQVAASREGIWTTDPYSNSVSHVRIQC